MPDEKIPEFGFSGFTPANDSQRAVKLTSETERIVEQLRANKKALELLFSTHGVRPDLAVVIGTAISRLCHLDAQVQQSREGKP
jgi:hypothetical protein